MTLLDIAFVKLALPIFFLSPYRVKEFLDRIKRERADR